MVRIDENQEAIALIRMAIDNDKKAQNLQDEVEMDASNRAPDTEGHTVMSHWTFGSSSGKRQESQELEKTFAPNNCDFVSFDDCLRSFLACWVPEDAPRYEDIIYVRSD